MILQDWWYTTLLSQRYPTAAPLSRDIKADVLILGGGMAGVSAAASFIGSGANVVLIEQNIVGGSSTGRSAGFLTPDSELELSQLIRRFGLEGAREIWEVPCRGIELIRQRVAACGIDCDLIGQDSLFLGLGGDGWEDVQAEAATRATLGLASTVYDRSHLTNIIGTEGFAGAIRYGETFGINALQYVQGLKSHLISEGIAVHESTAALSVEGHTVFTHAGSVTAEQIIVCIDKPPRALSPFADEVFHAQTFLAISEPLSDHELVQLFPSGDHLQCWDSSLFYAYFRLTGDRRLLLGGGSLGTTFLPQYHNRPGVIEGVIKAFRTRFPFLATLRFIQFWPGLIDCTRDLLPVIAREPDAPYRHHVMGCVGLPWASFCGDFIGRAVQGKADFDEARYYEYFSAKRPFLMPVWTERLLGKPVVFAINNAWAKYRQVDQGMSVQAKPTEF